MFCKKSQKSSLFSEAAKINYFKNLLFGLPVAGCHPEIPGIQAGAKRLWYLAYIRSCRHDPALPMSHVRFLPALQKEDVFS